MAEGYSPTHCGICGHRLEPDPPELFRRIIGSKRHKYERSVIDHDHRSGLCRGFLCERCNQHLRWLETGAIRGWVTVYESPDAKRKRKAREVRLKAEVRNFVSQQSSVKYK